MISLLSDVRVLVFLFKQNTSYVMRISDCSSDLCSSDLTWSSGGTGSPVSWSTNWRRTRLPVARFRVWKAIRSEVEAAVYRATPQVSSPTLMKPFQLARGATPLLLGLRPPAPTPPAAPARFPARTFRTLTPPPVHPATDATSQQLLVR